MTRRWKAYGSFPKNTTALALDNPLEVKAHQHSTAAFNNPFKAKAPHQNTTAFSNQFEAKIPNRNTTASATEDSMDVDPSEKGSVDEMELCNEPTSGDDAMDVDEVESTCPPQFANNPFITITAATGQTATMSQHQCQCGNCMVIEVVTGSEGGSRTETSGAVAQCNNNKDNNSQNYGCKQQNTNVMKKQSEEMKRIVDANRARWAEWTRINGW